MKPKQLYKFILVLLWDCEVWDHNIIAVILGAYCMRVGKSLCGEYECHAFHVGFRHKPIV